MDIVIRRRGLRGSSNPEYRNKATFSPDTTRADQQAWVRLAATALTTMDQLILLPRRASVSVTLVWNTRPEKSAATNLPRLRCETLGAGVSGEKTIASSSGSLDMKGICKEGPLPIVSVNTQGSISRRGSRSRLQLWDRQEAIGGAGGGGGTQQGGEG